jgi:hypothetical protein
MCTKQLKAFIAPMWPQERAELMIYAGMALQELASVVPKARLIDRPDAFSRSDVVAVYEAFELRRNALHARFESLDKRLRYDWGRGIDSGSKQHGLVLSGAYEIWMVTLGLALRPDSEPDALFCWGKLVEARREIDAAAHKFHKFDALTAAPGEGSAASAEDLAEHARYIPAIVMEKFLPLLEAYDGQTWSRREPALEGASCTPETNRNTSVAHDRTPAGPSSESAAAGTEKVWRPIAVFVGCFLLARVMVIALEQSKAPFGHNDALRQVPTAKQIGHGNRNTPSASAESRSPETANEPAGSRADPPVAPAPDARFSDITKLVLSSAAFQEQELEDIANSFERASAYRTQGAEVAEKAHAEAIKSTNPNLALIYLAKAYVADPENQPSSMLIDAEWRNRTSWEAREQAARLVLVDLPRDVPAWIGLANSFSERSDSGDSKAAAALLNAYRFSKNKQDVVNLLRALSGQADNTNLAEAARYALFALHTRPLEPRRGSFEPSSELTEENSSDTQGWQAYGLFGLRSSYVRLQKFDADTDLIRHVLEKQITDDGEVAVSLRRVDCSNQNYAIERIAWFGVDAGVIHITDAERGDFGVEGGPFARAFLEAACSSHA